MEFVSNIYLGRRRRVTYNGRAYIVAPLSMIPRDGVLPGSKGALYYPANETEAAAPLWNNIPITNGHPYDNLGNPASASDPGILDRFGMGFLRRPGMNGYLQAEGWFDEERTRKVNNSLYKKLLTGERIELSTGLFTDNEDSHGISPSGKPYEGIARNHKPDHLAALEHQTGACSLKEGCGILNSFTLNSIIPVPKPLRNQGDLKGLSPKPVKPKPMKPLKSPASGTAEAGSEMDRYNMSQVPTGNEPPKQGNFVSEEQRKYMWSQHPEIAEDWAHGKHSSPTPPHHMPENVEEDETENFESDKGQGPPISTDNFGGTQAERGGEAEAETENEEELVENPFKSEAQRRWMHANHPDMAEEWESHTPKGAKLPKHVGNAEHNCGTHESCGDILPGLEQGIGAGGGKGADTGWKHHEHGGGGLLIGEDEESDEDIDLPVTPQRPGRVSNAWGPEAWKASAEARAATGGTKEHGGLLKEAASVMPKGSGGLKSAKGVVALGERANSPSEHLMAAAGHNALASAHSHLAAAGGPNAEAHQKAAEAHARAGSAHGKAARFGDVTEEYRKGGGAGVLGGSRQKSGYKLNQRGPTGNASQDEATDATHAAVQASVPHQEPRGHAMTAMGHAESGSNEDAADSHDEAADVHDDKAHEARGQNDHASAEAHDYAAALHRKAASLHRLVGNQDHTEEECEDIEDECDDNPDECTDCVDEYGILNKRSTYKRSTYDRRVANVQRRQMLSQLVTNCACQEDAAALNGLTTRTLASLLSIRNANTQSAGSDATVGGTAEEREPDEDEEESYGPDSSGRRAPTNPESGSQRKGAGKGRWDYGASGTPKDWEEEHSPVTYEKDVTGKTVPTGNRLSMDERLRRFGTPEDRAVWNRAKMQERNYRLNLVHQLVGNIEDSRTRSVEGTALLRNNKGPEGTRQLERLVRLQRLNGGGGVANARDPDPIYIGAAGASRYGLTDNEAHEVLDIESARERPITNVGAEALRPGARLARPINRPQEIASSAE
jgi:hypothetical protein